MFQDEAGFGRINKPKSCWCARGIRPAVPCHHIREYRYANGAVDPMDGDGFFLIMPYCNTEYMQTYLNELSKEFRDDIIVLVCDGAAWHKAGKLKVPENMAMLFIPPYTPEMNPIEQIWKELRARGFCNEVFTSLEKVVDRLCETINHLAKETIISIARRDWISNILSQNSMTTNLSASSVFVCNSVTRRLLAFAKAVDVPMPSFLPMQKDSAH